MPVRNSHSRVAAAALALTAVAVSLAVGAAPTAAAPAVATPPSSLAQGQALASGAYLDDPASGQRLTMQSGGALVLQYLPAARTLWTSHTSVARSRLLFRANGDLAVISPSGEQLWHSGTRGSGLTLDFSTCGQMAIAQQWVSNACAVSGALLGARKSPDGRTTATQQHDGNLVVTTTAGGLGTRVLWASRTSGPLTAVLQRDQNFVLYKGSTAVWQTRTGRSGCAACQLPTLAMQDDGNLVLYSTASGHSAAVWSTRTTAASWGDPTLGMSSSVLGPVRIGMTVAQARAAAVVPMTSSGGCPLYSPNSRTFPSRWFTYDSRGLVDSVGSGNSQPFTDRTAAGITTGSTGNDIVRAYGSAARSYIDIYDTLNYVVASADGTELRFEIFGGHRTDVVSLVIGGRPSTVERTEICG